MQPRHPQRKNLDARLTTALHGEANERLGTGWPWEQSDEFSAVDTVRLLHVPRVEDVDLLWLSIKDLKKIVREWPSRSPLDLLRTIKVMLMGDDGTALSPQIPATEGGGRPRMAHHRAVTRSGCNFGRRPTSR